MCVCVNRWRRFYIGCDRCNEWFHGACVGIEEKDAAHIESYLCARCRAAAPPSSTSVEEPAALPTQQAPNAGLADLPLDATRHTIVQQMMKQLLVYLLYCKFTYSYSKFYLEIQ